MKSRRVGDNREDVGMGQGLTQRLLHRISFNAPGGYSLRPWLHRKRGVIIGRNVWISRLVYIDELHPEAVTIGDDSSIGIRSSIITHFYWGPRRTTAEAGRVLIEEDVFVGPHCVILPGVKIGRGAIIQAGTVVTRDVPSGLVIGYPKAVPVARAEVPLTHKASYEEFVRGLRPVRNKIGSEKQLDKA